MTKFFRVFWRDNLAAHVWYSEDTTLPLPESKPMKPRDARMAAMAVTGADHGVIVWSTDGYGYALYPKTARQIPWRGNDSNPAQDGAGH